MGHKKSKYHNTQQATRPLRAGGTGLPAARHGGAGLPEARRSRKLVCGTGLREAAGGRPGCGGRRRRGGWVLLEVLFEFRIGFISGVGYILYQNRLCAFVLRFVVGSVIKFCERQSEPKKVNSWSEPCLAIPSGDRLCPFQRYIRHGGKGPLGREMSSKEVLNVTPNAAQRANELSQNRRGAENLGVASIICRVPSLLLWWT